MTLSLGKDRPALLMFPLPLKLFQNHPARQDSLHVCSVFTWYPRPHQDALNVSYSPLGPLIPTLRTNEYLLGTNLIQRLHLASIYQLGFYEESH